MSKEPDGVEASAGMIELEAALDQAEVACDGDLRATVRALLVILDTTERKLETLRGDVARIEATVSGGYVRKSPRRREPGTA